MSFVQVGGDDGSKPTYFEVVAAERLAPSLKAAVIYTLSVLSQRHSLVHHLLKYEDEVFALITLLLDWHSLNNGDATFAEALYGLKRRSTHPQLSTNGSGAASKSSSQSKHAEVGMFDPKPAGLVVSSSPSPPSDFALGAGQRRATLLCQVVLPYLRAKCNRLYQRHAGRHSGILGLAIQYRDGRPPDQVASNTISSTASGAAASSQPLRQRTQAAALRLFLASWPWIHAACEASAFAYNLLYMLDASNVHHPLLHALRTRAVRVSSQDLVRAERAKTASRSSKLSAAAQQPFPLSALKKFQLKAGFVLADHTRNALVLAVFGIKALEWWYTSAEERIAASKVLPIPPPPPPPRPSPHGLPLPMDPTVCAVCRRKRTNPAQVVTSGYVFCYPCAFGYVTQHGCCPVTHLPASLDHIRKLFEGG